MSIQFFVGIIAGIPLGVAAVTIMVIWNRKGD